MVKLNYNNQSNQPGIYIIFNSQKWRIYVGQASRFEERWRDHLKSLRGNKHSNKFLQNDWNQCGENAFEFHVLEVMPGSSKEERNSREEYWIGIHWDKQEQCYNFKKKTESTERSCYSKTPEETSALISKRMKEVWANPDLRAKRLETHQSDEFREKQKQQRLKEIAENGGQDPSRLGTIAAWQNPEIRAKRIEGIIASGTTFRKGQEPWNKGSSPSEETKQKISKSLKGKPGTWIGRKHSEETKRKISEAKKKKA